MNVFSIQTTPTEQTVRNGTCNSNSGLGGAWVWDLNDPKPRNLQDPRYADKSDAQQLRLMPASFHDKARGCYSLFHDKTRPSFDSICDLMCTRLVTGATVSYTKLWHKEHILRSLLLEHKHHRLYAFASRMSVQSALLLRPSARYGLPNAASIHLSKLKYGLCHSLRSTSAGDGFACPSLSTTRECTSFAWLLALLK